MVHLSCLFCATKAQTFISLAKKAVVYVRIVTENFEPETCLFQNIKGKDGKAQTITDAIKVHVIDKKKFLLLQRL